MKIGAIDLIGVIDKTDFNGGIYTNITFENLVKEINAILDQLRQE